MIRTGNELKHQRRQPRHAHRLYRVGKAALGEIFTPQLHQFDPVRDVSPAAWELWGWARSPQSHSWHTCSEEPKKLSGKVILCRRTKPTGLRTITSTANLQNTDVCKCAHIPLGFAGLHPACYSCCNLWQFMEDESGACLINCPHPCSFVYCRNIFKPNKSTQLFIKLLSLDETLQIILEGAYRHDNEGLSISNVLAQVYY